VRRKRVSTEPTQTSNLAPERAQPSVGRSGSNVNMCLRKRRAAIEPPEFIPPRSEHRSTSAALITIRSHAHTHRAEPPQNGLKQRAPIHLCSPLPVFATHPMLLACRHPRLAEPRLATGSPALQSGSDDEEWEEELDRKVVQLYALLGPLDPFNGAVHPDDEAEINIILRARGVATRRKVEVLTELCTQVAGLQQRDREYVPGESQQSKTDSQLEREMIEYEQQEYEQQQTPQGSRASEEPDSLERMREPPGAFGSPVPRPEGLPQAHEGEPHVTSAGAASSSGRQAAATAAALIRDCPRAGRPSELAASGRSAQQGLKDVSDIARNAPGKAKALLDQQMAAAPEATGHANITAKSRAVVASLFESSGNVNETIEVVAHLLHRAEMRPIVNHLGYSQAATASDSMMVSSLAAFIEKHLYMIPGAQHISRTHITRPDRKITPEVVRCVDR
jgi:hypothetical protein